MNIKWHKRGPGVWYAEVDGVEIAEAALTGRYGSDDYPWDWHVMFQTDHRKRSGVEDTLRGCKDSVEQAWNLRGMDSPNALAPR